MKVHVHGRGHLAEITRVFVAFQGHELSGVNQAAVVWAAEDVKDGNHTEVIEGIVELVKYVTPGVSGWKKGWDQVVLVSSQLPTGSIKWLADQCPGVRFAYCPENFRLKDGPKAYLEQKRFVVGTMTAADRGVLGELFSFAPHVIWTSVESAEMVKHAMNAYLGMCIAFINEIAEVCRAVGADILDVEKGLRSEPRVSPDAPLHAGEPFGLGNIDRDLEYLASIHPTLLIKSIQQSNEWQKKKREKEG